MKKIVMMIFALIFLLGLSSPVSAADISGTIRIDGDFSDWDGVDLVIEDPLTESPDYKDLKSMKYVADNDYLYLCVEREITGRSEWDMQAVFLNGSGNLQSHHFPWDRPENYKPGMQWKNTMATTVKVNVNWEDWPKNQLRVQVSINGEMLEQTYSANKEGNRVEFRIPLKRVGLGGFEDEIKFALKSAVFNDLERIDWIPDKGPIVITKGPIFGGLTSIAVIAAFAAVGYTVIKRNKDQE